MPFPRRDVFPATQRTWIEQRLDCGEAGRREVVRHVMEVYAQPLAVYVAGSSFRDLGEPADLVHGYFADRLSRPGYLARWRASGLALRRWLMSGLCFYLKETVAKERRRGTPAALEQELPSVEPGPAEAMERALVQRIVQLALRDGEARCAADGITAGWQVFVRHRLEGRSYPDIAREIGAAAPRAATMARTAAKRFEAALKELLARDGVAPERMQEALAELHRIAAD